MADDTSPEMEPQHRRHGLSDHQLGVIAEVLGPYANRIDRVCVFGSRAVGTARANSDIDLVIYGALSAAEIDRIWTLFDESSLSVPVDVAAYDLVAYPPLRRHIDAFATRLFTGEELLRRQKTHA